MTTVVFLDGAIMKAALDAAERIGRTDVVASAELRAGVRDPVADWVEKIWNEIRDSVLDALRKGREVAAEGLRRVNELTARAESELGAQASRVTDILNRRLQDTFNQALSLTVERCPATIKVSAAELRLTEVGLTIAAKSSGSVGVSVQKLCEFAAEGSVGMSLKYSVA